MATVKTGRGVDIDALVALKGCYAVLASHIDYLLTTSDSREEIITETEVVRNLSALGMRAVKALDQ